MKSNSALPGGSLQSKPTWSNTFGCSATSAFFVLGNERRLVEGDSPMTEKNALVANPNRWCWFQGGHAMLVFSRKPGESVVVGNGITVTVVAVEGGRVRLGFNAPREVPIHRTEVHQRIEGWLPAVQHA